MTIDAKAAGKILKAAGPSKVKPAPSKDVIALRLERARLAFEEMRTTPPPRATLKRSTVRSLKKIDNRARKLIEALAEADGETMAVLHRRLDDEQIAKAMEAVMGAVNHVAPTGRLPTQHQDYGWAPLIDSLASIYYDTFNLKPGAGVNPDVPDNTPDAGHAEADGPFIRLVVAFCKEAGILKKNKKTKNKKTMTAEAVRDRIRNWRRDSDKGDFDRNDQ